MQKILLILLLSFSVINAEDNIWSKDTPALSQEKANKILQAYKNDDTAELTFVDDIKIKNNLYNFSENILNISLSTGTISFKEELTNQTGSKEYSQGSYNAKISVGKDFTFWHEDYTQPTRLYLTYYYTKLKEDSFDFTSWAVGIKENMFYWSFYKTDSYKIYPTISYEIGKSSLKREEYAISGLNMQADFGVTFAYRNNFEYFINLCASTISWQYPLDGIKDTMSGYGINIGISYKLNYGDF